MKSAREAVKFTVLVLARVSLVGLPSEVDRKSCVSTWRVVRPCTTLLHETNKFGNCHFSVHRATKFSSVLHILLLGLHLIIRILVDFITLFVVGY